MVIFDILFWAGVYLTIGAVASVPVCMSPMADGDDWNDPRDLRDWLVPLSVLTVLAWPIFFPMAMVWWAMSVILPVLLQAVSRRRTPSDEKVN